MSDRGAVLTRDIQDLFKSPCVPCRRAPTHDEWRSESPVVVLPIAICQTEPSMCL